MSGTEKFERVVATTRSRAGAWRDVLARESDALDVAGVRSGISVLELIGNRKIEATRRRAIRLLDVALPGSDLHGQIGPRRLSVLHSPVGSLTDLSARTSALLTLLRAADIEVAGAFASRRGDEPLVDTLARADAALDRAIFREEHRGSRLTLG